MKKLVLVASVFLLTGTAGLLAADFDGDGQSDFGIYRPNTGQWRVKGVTSCAFGQTGDIPVPADYDQDGKSDIAIFRPTAGATAGRWMIRGITRFGFGVANDTPLTGGNPMWNIPN
ncbi:MAG: hypothetical protein P9M08_04165, partial [Candidatus Erginobacter occultus]|nr:hypothetical protein [Candidatus Erginobacter occultus]